MNKEFKLQRRCKGLGVVHVCFVNDLLMFCRADTKSITIIQETFRKLSCASGLQATTDKSSIYVVILAPNAKEDIMQFLGYTKGSVPFKYLGVPLSTKKLTIN